MPSKPEAHNPFEPSRVNAGEGAEELPPRRMSLLLVIPLVTLASAVTFCCSCFPFTIAAFSFSSNEQMLGVLFPLAWVAAIALASVAAVRLWKHLRRPY